MCSGVEHVMSHAREVTSCSLVIEYTTLHGFCDVTSYTSFLQLTTTTATNQSIFVTITNVHWRWWQWDHRYLRRYITCSSDMCSILVLSRKVTLLVPPVNYIPLDTTTQFSFPHCLHWVSNWEPCVRPLVMANIGRGTGYPDWVPSSFPAAVTAVSLSGHCHLPVHHSSLILSSTHHILTFWHIRERNKNI